MDPYNHLRIPIVAFKSRLALVQKLCFCSSAVQNRLRWLLVCACACMRTCMGMGVCVCVHPCMLACVGACVYACAHALACNHACVCSSERAMRNESSANSPDCLLWHTSMRAASSHPGSHSKCIRMLYAALRCVMGGCAKSSVRLAHMRCIHMCMRCSDEVSAAAFYLPHLLH